MVDTLALGASEATHAGSSPVLGTSFQNPILSDFENWC